MKKIERDNLKSRVASLLKSVGTALSSVNAATDESTHVAKPEQAKELDQIGLFMTLMHEPYSKEAMAFTARLVGEMKHSSRGPKRAAQRALGMIAADLMRALREGPLTYLYRPVGAGAFTDGVVTYRPFTHAYKALDAQGMLIVEPGVIDFAPGLKGKATRFHPTPAMVSLAAEFGIDAAEFDKHFRPVSQRPKVRHPIRLRASTKRQYGAHGLKIVGKRMAVDHADPVVIAYARQVDEINAAIGNTPISAPHIGFRRVFNQGDVPGVHYDRGGRLYSIGGGYQQLSGDERSRMTVDGEPVVEWDISSSHLTIAMMMLGYPVPATGDLYAVPGVPRAIVKLYVNASLGNGKPIGKWPSDAVKGYAKPDLPKKPNKMKQSIIEQGYPYSGDLLADWPIMLLKKEVLTCYPVLGAIADNGIKWDVLQFRESCVVVNAVHELCTIHGVVALPVHDSIICKKSEASITHDVLLRHFKAIVGIEPTLKCK